MNHCPKHKCDDEYSAKNRAADGYFCALASGVKSRSSEFPESPNPYIHFSGRSELLRPKESQIFPINNPSTLYKLQVFSYYCVLSTEVDIILHTEKYRKVVNVRFYTQDVFFQLCVYSISGHNCSDVQRTANRYPLETNWFSFLLSAF